MKKILWMVLIFGVTAVSAAQDKPNPNGNYPPNAVRANQKEWAAFEKKLSTFRQTLSEKERRLLDSLIPGVAAGEQPQEAHQPGDRDSVGATKINGKQIRESNGSVVNCPEGTSVQAVPNGEGGPSGFNWLCVSNGA